MLTLIFDDFEPSMHFRNILSSITYIDLTTELNPFHVKLNTYFKVITYSVKVKYRFAKIQIMHLGMCS